MTKAMQQKIESAMENASDLLAEITKHHKANHPGLINHDINRDRLKSIDAVLKGAALLQRDEQFAMLLNKASGNGAKLLE